MTIEELRSVVEAGHVIKFDPDKRYVVVLDAQRVHHATTSELATQLRRVGVRASVVLADYQEDRTPPLQVFEMKAE